MVWVVWVRERGEALGRREGLVGELRITEPGKGNGSDTRLVGAGGRQAEGGPGLARRFWPMQSWAGRKLLAYGGGGHRGKTTMVITLVSGGKFAIFRHAFIPS